MLMADVSCVASANGDCKWCNLPTFVSGGNTINRLCPARLLHSKSDSLKVLAVTEKDIAYMPLGDYTESLLSNVGITSDWYVEVKKKFGAAPTCSCHARKEWLNSVGKYISDKLS